MQHEVHLGKNAGNAGKIHEKRSENARKMRFWAFIYHIYHGIYHSTYPINRGE